MEEEKKDINDLPPHMQLFRTKLPKSPKKSTKQLEIEEETRLKIEKITSDAEEKINLHKKDALLYVGFFILLDILFTVSFATPVHDLINNEFNLLKFLIILALILSEKAMAIIFPVIEALEYQHEVDKIQNDKNNEINKLKSEMEKEIKKIKEKNKQKKIPRN